MNKEKVFNTQIKSKINKDLLKIKNKCNNIYSKHKDDLGKMSPRDYIYFIFSSNIFYKTKDLIFLDKKLTDGEKLIYIQKMVKSIMEKETKQKNTQN